MEERKKTINTMRKKGPLCRKTNLKIKKSSPSELASFDPNAFVGDAEYPQDLCDFVLCLALAYNDFHDATLARLFLNTIPEPRRDFPSTQLGQYAALWISVIRTEVGFVHELLKVVETSAKVIVSPSFSRIFKLLSKEGKLALSSLHDVAMGKESNDELAKVLVRIRNKISFHYDPQELATGYKSAFSKKGVFDAPFISRGDSLEGTRFYFADAAAEAYLKLRVRPEDDDAVDFLWGGGDLLWKVNVALNEIVTRFIQARSGYRRFEP